MRKISPAAVDVVVARPAVEPVDRARNVLGIVPLPVVGLLVTGRSPIDLLPWKTIELSLLLPPLDVCLEVHLVIHAPLRRVTARPSWPLGLAAAVVRCSGAVSLRL